MSAWISGIISVSERVGGGREVVRVYERGGGGGGKRGKKEGGGACVCMGGSRGGGGGKRGKRRGVVYVWFSQWTFPVIMCSQGCVEVSSLVDVGAGHNPWSVW